MLNVHYGCWMLDGCKHTPFDADAMVFPNKKLKDNYELWKLTILSLWTVDIVKPQTRSRKGSIDKWGIEGFDHILMVLQQKWSWDTYKERYKFDGER